VESAELAHVAELQSQTASIVISQHEQEAAMAILFGLDAGRPQGALAPAVFVRADQELAGHAQMDGEKESAAEPYHQELAQPVDLLHAPAR